VTAPWRGAIREGVKLLLVCGSLQARSSNLELLARAAELAPAGIDARRFEAIAALPYFDPDLDAAPEPAPVAEWRHALREADAVLIASPEYGHSLPGALKNAIDWVIGSGELHEKAVAITASVPHPERGRRGLEALATTLRAVNVRLTHEAPIARGPGFDAELRACVEALLRVAASPS
jgi:chromate reductase, NAD(P)H dehydrogenase (quinone)